MIIHVLARDGSPLGVTCEDIYGNDRRVGVGGAELAILTLMEGWHNAGHTVVFYNNPTMAGGSPFRHAHVNQFIPQEDRDILIIFRSPNPLSYNAKGRKVWFSTDQYTIDDFAKFSKKVDKIVTISPFHAQHFKEVYGIEDTITIDLPVRIQDYGLDEDAQECRVPNRLIYCSVPDRGLAVLAQAYPIIKSAVPDASLVITSDYRLWGLPDARNEQYLRKFFGMDGVQFLGAIPRRLMVHEQKKAQIMAYPSSYDELFCYAVAECQVAGAYPVTTSQGALITTNMGLQVAGSASDPRWFSLYAEAVIHALRYENMEEKRNALSRKAIERFSLERIMKEWDKVLND